MNLMQLNASGSIDGFGRLTALKELRLKGNRFNGQLPAVLAQAQSFSSTTSLLVTLILASFFRIVDQVRRYIDEGGVCACQVLCLWLPGVT